MEKHPSVSRYSCYDHLQISKEKVTIAYNNKRKLRSRQSFVMVFAPKIVFLLWNTPTNSARANLASYGVIISFIYLVGDWPCKLYQSPVSQAFHAFGQAFMATVAAQDRRKSLPPYFVLTAGQLHTCMFPATATSTRSWTGWKPINCV